MIRATFAPAKVNLFLHVGPPRTDGFHPLYSLMVFASFGDSLTVSEAERLALEMGGPFGGGLADGDDNLVLRAARALQARLQGPRPPVRLSLDKRLPISSGLGGGSADAGAALRLLRGVWAPELPDAELEAIAASLGSDGAACLWGRPVFAEGRGERLTPAPGLPVLDAVLVNPNVEVSTAAAYRGLDASGVFADVEPTRAPGALKRVEDVAAWLVETRNDLQAPALALAPEIGEVLGLLGDAPEVLFARMSGSGATCFALCAGEPEAAHLARQIEMLRPGWWVKPCRLGGPWGDEAAC